MSSAPVYRADIDGLRALAVAAVIFYHAAVPGFAGGFVGVDVFFVISGYLITLVLVGSQAGTTGARLIDFYVRRARRILPALGVVALATTAAALLILLPADLQRFGKFLAATPVFATNLAARSEGGYFAAGSMPPAALNHLWSIAVEEQFYVVYPLLLLLVGRLFTRRRIVALAVLAAVSFALCLWAAEHAPNANYYLPPTRGWELLLGALVALAPPFAVRGRVLREALAAASGVVLVAAFVGYDASLRYPGAATLAPCLATAWLLAADRTQPTATGRLLALRPLVFTGLISYSLYLWHWPVLIFVRYWLVTEPTATTRCLLIAAIYALAALTWKLVEQPVRRRTALPRTRGFVMAAVAANAVLLAAGVALWQSRGLPSRFSAQVQALVATGADFDADVQRCASLSLVAVRAGELCAFGASDPALPTALVWGDSHGMALVPAYKELAAKHGVRLFFAATSACAPLVGVARAGATATARERCRQFGAAVMAAVQRLAPRLVILNGYWSYYDDLALDDASEAPPAEAALRRGLEQTLIALGADHRSTCVVLDVPTLEHSVPYALAMAHRRGLADDFIGIDRSAAYAQTAHADAELRAARAPSTPLVADPKSALCRTQACAFEAGGTPLYRDTNHLTIAGARAVAPALDACFAEL